MLQGLKNAPSEFQNIMNNIFNPCIDFTLLYLDDVLVFSKKINQHFDHIEKFHTIIKENWLVISTIKMKLTKVRFLGFEIFQGTITPISRLI